MNTSTQNAIVTGSGDRWFRGITLTNTHTTRNITIKEMIVSWTPDNSEVLERVRIAGNTVYNTNANSGDLLDIINTQVAAGESNIEIEIRFNTSVAGKAFTIYFFYDDGSSSITDFIPGLDTSDAGYLAIDTTGANITDGNPLRLQDITLSNQNTTRSISIESIFADWFYDSPVRYLERVRIGSQNKWTGSEPASSNVTLDSPQVLSALQDRELQLFFDDDVRYRRFMLTFHMGDDSEKSTTINFMAENAAQLQFINNYSLLSPYKHITGLQLKNTNSLQNIWLDKMQIALEPDAGQLIEEISIGGSTVFSGAATQNSTIDLSVTTINATQTVALEIEFDDSIQNTTLNILATMIDETTSLNVFTTATIAQNTLFSMTTENARITPRGNRKTLEEIPIHNNFGNTYTIDRIKAAWVTNNGELLTDIQINSASKWPGGGDVASDTWVDITDTSILGGSTNIPLAFIFNTDMRNIDFTLTFMFTDATTTEYQVVLNPQSYIAADNAEGGQYDGGYGFSGDWIVANGNWVLESDNNNTYSGRYAFRIRNSTKVSRLLDLSGQSDVKIRFVAKMNSVEAGENFYFRFYDASGTPHEWNWGGGDLADHTHIEENLSDYPMGINCKIEFEIQGDQNNDQVFIDEIYFFKPG